MTTAAAQPTSRHEIRALRATLKVALDRAYFNLGVACRGPHDAAAQAPYLADVRRLEQALKAAPRW